MKRSTRVVGGFNGKFFENERNFLSIDRNNLLGCKYCHGALGMENRAISDSRISASSQWDANHAATQARLFYQAAGNKRGAWSARTNDANQWLQVQLHTIYKITFVATQGRNGVDQWVSKYMLHYSKDGEHFQYYRERGHNTNKVIMNRDKKKHVSVNSQEFKQRYFFVSSNLSVLAVFFHIQVIFLKLLLWEISSSKSTGWSKIPEVFFPYWYFPRIPHGYGIKDPVTGNSFIVLLEYIKCFLEVQTSVTSLN